MAQVKVQTAASLCGSSLSPTMQLPSVNSSGPLGLQASVNGTAPAPTCTSPAAVVADSGVSPNSPASLQDNMANPKEKTPMCLVNELARFNRNQPQYNLLSERGPAHAKIFTVQLNLGEQSWEAEGTSIKKAQHAAAALALKETTLPRPSPRPPKNIVNSNPGSITPTVELNGLAMKRGEPAIYRPLDSKPLPNYRGNYNFRGMYNQRYYYPVPKIFYVQLTVGNSEFIGEGRTRQAARHNAAMKALQALRNEPIPEKAPQLRNKSPTVDDIRTEEAQGWLKKLNEEVKEEEEPKETQDDKDANKSEISLVFEIALKRNMPVNFEVIKESGPPHMKSFVTRVTVGEFIAEGEGNSKKLSKKRAAIAVLQELKKLPPLPVIEKPKLLFKKRPKTILKTGPEYGQGMNPISRLAQIQQAKKEKEPEYMLLSERGMPRRREFVMQVKVGNEGATGTGPSKKVAKRNAAEAMLLQLGYKASTPLQTATEKALSRFLQLKGPEPNENKAWNGQTSSFPEQTSNSQKGILHLSPDVYQEMEASRNKGTPGSTVNYLPHKEISQSPSAFFNNTAAIPRELLLNGASPAAEAIGLKGKAPSSSSVVVQPTQQLEYLARIQGFQAALSALKQLSEQGLDPVDGAMKVENGAIENSSSQRSNYGVFEGTRQVKHLGEKADNKQTNSGTIAQDCKDSKAVV